MEGDEEKRDVGVDVDVDIEVDSDGIAGFEAT